MEKITMKYNIQSQPEMLKSIIDGHGEIFENVGKIFNKSIKYVYFLGSGTSFHASQFGEWAFKHLLNLDSKAMVPTLFNNYELNVIEKVHNKEDILVVGISQSGTSISTISALKSLKEKGIKTLLLTEAVDSVASGFADHIISIKCGKEGIPVETKGYTATILTLYMLALEAGLALEKLDDTKYSEMINELNTLPEMVLETIKRSYSFYEEHLNLYKDMSKIFFVGYGVQYITAQEATLKLFETNHEPVNFYELEESIHGPQMAIDKDTFIFILGSDGVELKGLQKYVNYFESLTDNVFLITNKELSSKQEVLTISEDINYLLSVINFTIPVHVMSDVISKANGKDTSVHPLGDNRGFSHTR